MKSFVKLFQKAALGVGVVAGLLLLAEGTLALVGFERTYARIYIGGDPEDPANAEKAIVDDSDLLWRFQPGQSFQGRPINELGFLGRALPREKEQGRTRVLCMGDSCTAEGEPPYADILHNLLSDEESEWEAFNMAVHGYSIVQGRKLFQIKGAAFDADYVTLYFGWNDHWLDQYPDSTRMRHEQHQVVVKIYRKLLKRRFFQFLVHLSDPGRKRLRSDSERVLRVPADEYVAELKEFISDIRATGAEPVLITAPRAQQLSQHLVRNDNVDSVERAMNLHDEYVRLTKNVAETTGTMLIDLAAILDGDNVASYFRPDGVHLTQQGLERTAQIVQAALQGH